MKSSRAFFSVSTDFLLGLEDRRYLEVTGLPENMLAHIQVIDDMRKLSE